MRELVLEIMGIIDEDINGIGGPETLEEALGVLQALKVEIEVRIADVKKAIEEERA